MTSPNTLASTVHRPLSTVHCPPSTIHHPPSTALRTLRTALLILLLVTLARPLLAHHILGIPHYKYDENYPQIPYVEVMAQTGPHDLTFTYFPGFPKPGERVRFKLYVRNREDGTPFREPMKARIVRRHFLRGDEIMGDTLDLRTGDGPEKNDYKFFVTFPDRESYELRVEFPTPAGVEVIPFPVEVGKTDDRPLIFGAIGILGIAIVSVATVKRRRRRR